MNTKADLTIKKLKGAKKTLKLRVKVLHTKINELEFNLDDALKGNAQSYEDFLRFKILYENKRHRCCLLEAALEKLGHTPPPE